jgi:hypothetical protein
MCENFTVTAESLKIDTAAVYLFLVIFMTFHKENNLFHSSAATERERESVVYLYKTFAASHCMTNEKLYQHSGISLPFLTGRAHVTVFLKLCYMSQSTLQQTLIIH